MPSYYMSEDLSRFGEMGRTNPKGLADPGWRRISWDEAWQLIERAVRRGLRAKPKRVPARLGVDEKALSKWARYVTLVCDLDSSSVEYVAEDRRMESLDGYFGSFPATQLEGIRAIAMDMWPPYISSTLRTCSGRATRSSSTPTTS